MKYNSAFICKSIYWAVLAIVLCPDLAWCNCACSPNMDSVVGAVSLGKPIQCTIAQLCPSVCHQHTIEWWTKIDDGTFTHSTADDNSTSTTFTPTTACKYTVECRITGHAPRIISKEVYVVDFTLLHIPPLMYEYTDCPTMTLDVQPSAAVNNQTQYTWSLVNVPSSGTLCDPQPGDNEIEQSSNTVKINKVHWFPTPNARTGHNRYHYTLSCSLSVAGAPFTLQFTYDVLVKHSPSDTHIFGHVSSPHFTGSIPVRENDNVWSAPNLGTFARSSPQKTVYPMNGGDFHTKYDAHENVHMNSYTDEFGMFRDTWNVDTVWNAVKDLEYDDREPLIQAIQQAMQAEIDRSMEEVSSQEYYSECNAYLASNAISPDCLENDDYL